MLLLPIPPWSRRAFANPGSRGGRAKKERHKQVNGIFRQLLGLHFDEQTISPKAGVNHHTHCHMLQFTASRVRR
jgi:hypothetical protein